MQQKLLYIELKSDQNHRGPAWIGFATMSKSGRTVYFNGKALKRMVGGGACGNHFCIESGDEYWVSGVKRDGSDRHWIGRGPVMVEARAVGDYLACRRLAELDPKAYRVVTDIQPTDVAKFRDLENQPYNPPLHLTSASGGRR